jgi:hypothetical protein
MKLFNALAEFIQSVIESVARLFKPSQDNYPATGVQPYTGDPSEETISG